ncbi:hypothetical protein RB601_001936 [Gaeumannomyces tritici]
MKLLLFSALLAVGHGAPSTNKQLNARQGAAGGTGKYPAAYTTDSSLPKHTIYAPKTVPQGVKLPIMVWGNGACAADGLAFRGFLTEVASHGYVIIASGAPNGQGSTTSKQMRDAIDWISARAGTAGTPYAAVDKTKVAAAGMSCGGVEAYDQKDDARVATLGIFNSGLLQNTGAVATIRKPVFYFMGGTSDIAYQNAERDYKGLPAGTPSWKGNLPVGHGGTYNQANGGKFGKAAVHWLNWVLKGDATSGAYFKTSAAAADGFTVEKKNLDKLPA